MLNTLPILTDRAMAALAAKGLRAKRSAVIEVLAATLGFRSENEIAAASKAGTLDVPVATRLATLDAQGIALAVLHDPTTNGVFAVEERLLPTDGHVAIATAPLGRLVRLPAPMAASGRRPFRSKVLVRLLPGHVPHIHDENAAGLYDFAYDPDEIVPEGDPTAEQVREATIAELPLRVSIKREHDFQVTYFPGIREETGSTTPPAARDGGMTAPGTTARATSEATMADEAAVPLWRMGSRVHGTYETQDGKYDGTFDGRWHLATADDRELRELIRRDFGNEAEPDAMVRAMKGRCRAHEAATTDDPVTLREIIRHEQESSGISYADQWTASQEFDKLDCKIDTAQAIAWLEIHRPTDYAMAKAQVAAAERLSQG